MKRRIQFCMLVVFCMLIFGSALALAAEVLYESDFSRDRPPGWVYPVPTGGRWTVADGKMTYEAGDGVAVTWLHSHTFGDARHEVKFSIHKIGDADWYGIRYRFHVSEDDMDQCYEVMVTAADVRLAIYGRQADGVTLYAEYLKEHSDVEFKLELGREYALRVDVIGNKFTVYIDDVKMFEAEDPEARYSKGGIILGCSVAGASFWDLKVTSID